MESHKMTEVERLKYLYDYACNQLEKAEKKIEKYKIVIEYYALTKGHAGRLARKTLEE